MNRQQVSRKTNQIFLNPHFELHLTLHIQIEIITMEPRRPGKAFAYKSLEEEITATYPALPHAKIKQILDMAESAELNPEWNKAAQTLSKQPQTAGGAATRPHLVSDHDRISKAVHALVHYEVGKEAFPKVWGTVELELIETARKALLKHPAPFDMPKDDE